MVVLKEPHPYHFHAVDDGRCARPEGRGRQAEAAYPVKAGEMPAPTTTCDASIAGGLGETYGVTGCVSRGTRSASVPPAFAHDWQDAAYEKGETQSFYNDFFGVFGVRRRPSHATRNMSPNRTIPRAISTCSGPDGSWTWRVRGAKVPATRTTDVCLLIEPTAAAHYWIPGSCWSCRIRPSRRRHRRSASRWSQARSRQPRGCGFPKL